MVLFFNILGGTLRWFCEVFWRHAFNKKQYRFSEYLFGSEDSNGLPVLISYRFTNVLLALVVGGILLISIVVI